MSTQSIDPGREGDRMPQSRAATTIPPLSAGAPPPGRPAIARRDLRNTDALARRTRVRRAVRRLSVELAIERRRNQALRSELERLRLRSGS